jgi:hypothetical protein
MDSPANLTWIANYIWGIADDVLRDLYVRGKYRDVILPITVLRRLDAVLEPTKQAVLDMKASLDIDAKVLVGLGIVFLVCSFLPGLSQHRLECKSFVDRKSDVLGLLARSGLPSVKTLANASADRKGTPPVS